MIEKKTVSRVAQNGNWNGISVDSKWALCQRTGGIPGYLTAMYKRLF